MKSKSHLIIGTLSTIEFSLLTGIELTPTALSIAAILSAIPDLDEPNSNVGSYVVSKKITKAIHSILMYSMIVLFFYFFYKSYKNVYLGIFLSIIFIIFMETKVSANKTRAFILSLFLGFLGFLSLILKLNPGISMIMFLFAFFPIFKHRSFTHSIFMVLILFCILLILEYSFKINNVAIIGSFAYSTHLVCDIITKRGIPLFYPFSKKYYSLGKLRVGKPMCNVVEILVIFSLIIMILYHLR